ncbi:MAG: response regulator [Verrucomicrobia bacterium]|nr:response regulator [Verrucomicrobiota bacterium]
MTDAADQRKATIMIVDDQEPVRSLVSDLLTGLDFDVITAKDGQEAVETYRRLMDEAREQERIEHPVDLVILDMVLPNCDGKETFQRLRETNPDVRVIISSGYDVDDRVQEAIGLGAVGFLQKPYHIETLLNLVRKVLV